MDIFVLIVVIVVLAIFAAFVLGFFDAPEPKKKSIVKEGTNGNEDVRGILGNDEQAGPRDACISLCMKQLDAGVDLSNGPCLSNGIVEGWVCDVAHNPRVNADNQKENQCPEFGKSASHFVEVDPKCNFIREI